MKQFYYGFWQEMYYHTWPTRLLIELLIFLLLVFFIWKFCKWLSNILHIKRNFVKFTVLLVTEFDGLFGRNTRWAIANDEKICDWGKKALEQPSKKWHFITTMLKRAFIATLLFSYFLAAGPDLPYKNMITPYYLQHLSNIKKQFQFIETTLSKGYEAYPAFFEKEVQQETQEYLLIIAKTKKQKVPIYKTPSIKSKIIGKIGNNQKVIYKNQYKKTTKKNWLKVYVPKYKMTGWLNSNFVEERQVDELVQ